MQTKISEDLKCLKIFRKHCPSNINVKKLRNDVWYRSDEKGVFIPHLTGIPALAIALHEIGHCVCNHNSKENLELKNRLGKRKLQKYLQQRELEAWDFVFKIFRLEKIPITKKFRETVNGYLGTYGNIKVTVKRTV